MRTFLLVCAGGALGTAARYLVALAIPRKDFPVAVLLVNLAGSFAVGALMMWFGKRGVPQPIVGMWTTGFLGGFTTYSAFNYDLTAMIADGAFAKAALYAAATVVGCLAAGFAGLMLAR